MGRALSVIIAAGLILVVAETAFAQKYSNVGRGKCFSGCHDHDGEKEWSEKKDGPPPDNHLNALKQMDVNARNKNAESTKKYIMALGIADPYDPATSTCLKCHATIVKGEPTGVYCETCHGAASGYLDPHKDKGWYDKSKPAGLLGMADVKGKPQSWAAICMKCHIMDDPRLIVAGHKSGDDFDLGEKFQKVMVGHWKSTYTDKDKPMISQLGKQEAGKIVAVRKTIAPTAVSTPPATQQPPVIKPTAAAPAAPQLPAPPPPAPPSTAPPSTAPPPTPISKGPALPANRGAPNPSNRDQTAPPAQTAVTQPASSSGLSSLPPQTSVAGLPPNLDASTASMSGYPTFALPQSPAAAVAAVQGRAIAMLDALLRRGASAPVRITPPDRKTRYLGPEADLLQLQEDVLSLAIEALKSSPAVKPAVK